MNPWQLPLPQERPLVSHRLHRRLLPPDEALDPLLPHTHWQCQCWPLFCWGISVLLRPVIEEMVKITDHPYALSTGMGRDDAAQ